MFRKKPMSGEPSPADEYLQNGQMSGKSSSRPPELAPGADVKAKNKDM